MANDSGRAGRSSHGERGVRLGNDGRVDAGWRVSRCGRAGAIRGVGWVGVRRSIVGGRIGVRGCGRLIGRAGGDRVGRGCVGRCLVGSVVAVSGAVGGRLGLAGRGREIVGAGRVGRIVVTAAAAGDGDQRGHTDGGGEQRRSSRHLILLCQSDSAYRRASLRGCLDCVILDLGFGYPPKRYAEAFGSQSSGTTREEWVASGAGGSRSGWSEGWGW